MIPLMCEILKRYEWTYLQNKNRLTDIENKCIGLKKKKEVHGYQKVRGQGWN